MENIILVLVVVPVVMRAVLGWRMGADVEMRRLLVYVVAGVVTLVFGNYVANWLAQGFGRVEPHVLLACIFLVIFALAAGVATLVLNCLGVPAEGDALRLPDRALGFLVGLVFGALIGAVLIAVAGLIIPSLAPSFDSASIPLVGDKPLVVVRALEKRIALAPWVPLPTPTPESSEPAAPAPPPAVPVVAAMPAASVTPVVVAAPAPPAPVVPAAPVATPPPRPRVNYRNFPYDKALEQAKQNRETTLTLQSAYRLDQLEEAKAKAQREGKLMGFIMVWDSFFNEPEEPMGTGSRSGLVHFYQAFNDSTVLVFVRHENELNLVPDAVKRGFFGPEEGGFAPNMAVVSADAVDYICEIPYGGNHSDGSIRDAIFRNKIDTIKTWLAAQVKAP